jgi:Icc-related predicted phosphoesterase
MTLQVMSDLHLEFFGDKWHAFVESLPVLADILVLPGDVHVGRDIMDALRMFGTRWKHVLFVPGNHEFYNVSPDMVARYRGHVAGVAPNVHWLENETVTIDGQRFVGTTLWFEDCGDVRLKRCVSDFYVIRGLEPWVYEQNAKAKRFLETEVKSSDVVLTHHLPHPESVAEKYRGDATNAFFLCDVSGVIDKAQPRLWIHGHTHESVDVRVGATRIVCNPYGYDGREINPAFRKDLVVEVP